MINLNGQERGDENHNQQPEIYSLLQIADDSEPFHRRINAFRLTMRQRGFEPVYRSAYLKYHLFDLLRIYKRPIGKIKTHLSIPPELPRLQNEHDMVFIWNVDDITMLSRDHIEELRILRPDMNSMKLCKLKELICEGVNGLDDSMNIIRKVDNIEDALLGETDDMRRAAPIYDALKQLYNDHGFLEKLGILEQEKELCQIIKKHQKVYNQRWKYAKRCIELINRRSAKSKIRKFANIVISEEGVASAAAQLMLAGLSSSIPIENIYSKYTLPGEVHRPLVLAIDPQRTARTSPVVDRIRRRFGENCCLVYIATGRMYIGREVVMWRIAANESIKMLYDLQRDTLK